MTTARGEMARECGGGEVCRGEGPARQSTPACRSQAAGSSARGGAADQAKRMLRIDLFCQKCHDIDNDVHWQFDKRWPEVIHMNKK